MPEEKTDLDSKSEVASRVATILNTPVKPLGTDGTSGGTSETEGVKPLDADEVGVAYVTYRRVMAEKHAEHAQWTASAWPVSFGVLSGSIGLVILVIGFALEAAGKAALPELAGVGLGIAIVGTAVVAVSALLRARSRYNEAAKVSLRTDLAVAVAAEAVLALRQKAAPPTPAPRRRNRSSETDVGGGQSPLRSRCLDWLRNANGAH